MGGPASSLLWCIGLDPLLFFIEDTVRVQLPTYVGDIAGLTRGPRQTYYLQLTLVVISHLCGLFTEAHTCARLWCPGFEAVAAA